MWRQGKEVLFNCLHWWDYLGIDQASIRCPNDPTPLFGHTSYRFIRTVTETQVASRDPAKLLVGGDLTLNGSRLNNDKCQVIIRGLLKGNLQHIDNKDAMGVRVIADNGLSQHFKHHYSYNPCGGLRINYRQEMHFDGHAVPYTPQERINFPLKVVLEQRNTRPTRSGVQIAERVELALPPSAPTHGQLVPSNPLPAISEVTALARHPSTGLAMVVRSSNTPLSLPIVEVL